ncbi:MAG TPA: cytochrome c3 family protein [Nitrospinota bacterium]|nr:cytochrome c3 family protein [Nitrospinota bacterium]|tara:strand:+ start:15556 stop:16095 length:540 start_codon:yes stop_codon:yes gene_type:complete
MVKFGSLSTTAKVVLGFIGTAIATFLVLFYIFYEGPFYLVAHQPTQPINYSHKVHADDNKIPCQYCHTFARRSEMSGVPGAARCMNCHESVKQEAPEIKKVIAHYENNKPIEWVKVFDLPDHVWFSHKKHIAKDVSCQTCHGPIEKMDVVSRTNDFQMGFCLDCHQENEAPTDCWTCHT